MTDNNSVRLIHDNGRVILIVNNDPKGLAMPWQKADEVIAAMRQVTREAEEYCKANRIVADNALMQRAGLPVGLSNNPAIMRESIKEALYDRDLRRALPPKKAAGLGDIQTRGVVGTPMLRRTHVR